MQVPCLSDLNLRRIGACLTSGSVLQLALTCSAWLAAFFRLGRWRLASLRLDGNGERVCNPNGVFSAVETNDVRLLSASGLGLQLFREVLNWPFEALQRLELIDCLFENGGAEAIAHLLHRHQVSQVLLRRCFLVESDFVLMAPVAASLEELHLAEVGRSESLGAGFVGLLQKCGKLRHLELRGNFVLSSSVISAITGHQSLQCLRIQNNSVLDDQTVQQLCQGLAQAVSSVVKLTTLDLSSSGGVGRLSDRSGKAIGSMLAAGVRLRELSLRGQQLSLGGLAACIGIHQTGKVCWSWISLATTSDSLLPGRPSRTMTLRFGTHSEQPWQQCPS